MYEQTAKAIFIDTMTKQAQGTEMHYICDSGGHALVFPWVRFELETRNRILNGKIELAFVHEGALIHFLFRCPGYMKWTFSTFASEWVIEKRKYRPNNIYKDGEGILLQILLLRDSNNACGQRFVNLGTEFSRKLETALKIQSQTPYDIEADGLYRRALLFKPEQMLARADNYFCTK